LRCVVAEILERDGYRVRIKVEVPASQVEQTYQAVLVAMRAGLSCRVFGQERFLLRSLRLRLGKNLYSKRSRKFCARRLFLKRPAS
jgi:trigger factor